MKRQRSFSLFFWALLVLTLLASSGRFVAAQEGDEAPVTEATASEAAKPTAEHIQKEETSGGDLEDAQRAKLEEDGKRAREEMEAREEALRQEAAAAKADLEAAAAEAAKRAADDVAAAANQLEADAAEATKAAAAAATVIAEKSQVDGGRGVEFANAVQEHLSQSREKLVKSLRGGLVSYNALLKKHYLRLSFLQATVLGAIGDIGAQWIERRTFRQLKGGAPRRWNRRRTFHVGLLTMTIDGIFTPRWYKLLERYSTERTLRVVAFKTVLGSAVYGPFANGLFLAGIPLLRYGSKGMAGGFDLVSWRRQLLIATMRDIQMWLPFNALNFALVPMHARPLASNLMGLFFVCVLSSSTLGGADFLPFGEGTAELISNWLGGVFGGKKRLSEPFSAQ